MELKLDTWVDNFNKEVLIVPLWNWNKESAYTGFGRSGFNCTFMELKLV